MRVYEPLSIEAKFQGIFFSTTGIISHVSREVRHQSERSPIKIIIFLFYSVSIGGLHEDRCKDTHSVIYKNKTIKRTDERKKQIKLKAKYEKKKTTKKHETNKKSAENSFETLSTKSLSAETTIIIHHKIVHLALKRKLQNLHKTYQIGNAKD